MPPTNMRRYKGKTEQSDGRVHVKVEFGQSDAAFARLGRAIFAFDATLTSTHVRRYGSRCAAEAILKLPIEHIDEAMEALQPCDWEYRSPSFFYRSSIRGIYDSPEDEVNDRPCERYIEYTQREKDWMTPEEREEYERARAEGMDCK